MKQRIGIAILVCAVVFACTPNNVKTDAAIAKIMDSAGMKGCFALMENGSGQFTITDLSMYKDSAYAPLATFFAVPSLIALDRGYINHNAATWITTDSINYYVSLMEKISRADLIKTIDSLHYGKGIISASMNDFWKDASLRITADEQLGFIKKLYFNELPFQKRSQDMYKKMILKEDNAGYKLSYIQGIDASKAAWIMGYVEENKHPYFFVMHSTTIQSNKTQIDVLKSILLQQGFLKGVR
jgi:beta-lactamase class D